MIVVKVLAPDHERCAETVALIEEVARAARWNGRLPVRRALVSNPFTAPSTANANGRQAKDFSTIKGVVDGIVLITTDQHLVLQ